MSLVVLLILSEDDVWCNQINQIEIVELEQLTQLLTSFDADDLYPTSLIRSIDYLLDNDNVKSALQLCHHLIKGKGVDFLRFWITFKMI